MFILFCNFFSTFVIFLLHAPCGNQLRLTGSAWVNKVLYLSIYGDSDCLNDLPPPNDPDFWMSPILLFSKLIYGHFLSETTIVATRRPTAHKFYSKFNFDRTVEIIGFTEDGIDEYVTQFYHSHERNDLKLKILLEIDMQV